MRTIVYKLGGSLYDLPQFPERLRSLVQSVPPHQVVIVAGGGSAADLVRHWDDTFKFGDTIAHQLAIESMRLTAALVARLLPETTLVRNRADLCLTSSNRWGLFDPAELLTASTEFELLPSSWDVTSDSIAAQVAQAWSASALVLCKSREIPPDCTVEQAAANGLVDPYFPRASQGITEIQWCNLRMCARPQTQHLSPQR